MKSMFKKIAAAALVLFCMTASRAEDIDLYVGGESVTGAETNVLIFLDNSANWSNASGWASTQGEAELDALATVIDSLPENSNVNVGVMMHTRTGSTSGAYVRFSMRSMGTAANRTALKQVFADIKSTAPNAPQDKVAQSADGDAAIEEVLRYFNSLNLGFTAARDAKEDYQSNTAYYDAGGGISSALADAAHPSSGLAGWAYSSSSDTSYDGPSSATDGCARNFLIWIGNTNLDGSTSGTRLTAAAGELHDESEGNVVTADTSQITTYHDANTSPEGKMFDEWARFMFKYGVISAVDDPTDTTAPIARLWNNITTYTVDVFPASNPSSPPNSCIGDTGGGAQQVGQHYNMQSGATNGGGKCFPATNVSQLAKALQTIFLEIQAVNSVFSSATLPVSVNTQGTYENQIYIGMFRPDGQMRPRWYGNLKEYQFSATADGNLFLSDKFGSSAINANTGFITDTATSFWTCDPQGTSGSSNICATPGFWGFSPQGPGGQYDGPDGQFVEKGGQAYMGRQFWTSSGRNVYTCLSSCLTATSGGTPTTLYSDSNKFLTTNTELETKLTAAGQVTVQLARTLGNPTVTASVTSGTLGLVNGDAIVLTANTGATAGYATTTAVPSYTVSSVDTASTPKTFQFSITESPASPATLAVGGTPITVTPTASSGTLSGVTVNWSTNTVSANVSSGTYGANTTVNIVDPGTNPSWAFLNLTNGTVSQPGGAGTAISYTFTPPANVATCSPAGGLCGTSVLSGTTWNNTAITRTANVVRIDVDSAGSLPNFTATSGTVTVASTTPSFWSANWTILNSGNGCSGGTNNSSWCFTLSAPIVGAPTISSSGGAAVDINITRSGATATAVTTSGLPHGLLPSATVQIAGAAQSEYNLATTATVGADLTRFTYTVAVSPAAVDSTSGSWVATPYSGGTVVTAPNLINWVRGMDAAEDENVNTSRTDVRASLHADVLHSRPLVINYGGTTGVVAFYGTNDGLLHAVKAGRGTGVVDAGSADDGKEKWAFIPDEFVSRQRLSRLYNNEPLVLYPELDQSAISPVPTRRDYYWDGNIGVYRGIDPTCIYASTPCTNQVVYIFPTARRGGPVMYALDVTNPDQPKFLWRLAQSGQFANLGYTWSEPRVVFLKGGTYKKVALVFGAGQNPTEDDLAPVAIKDGAGVVTGYTYPVRNSSTVGSGVFVVDLSDNSDVANGVKTKAAFLQPKFPAGANTKRYSFPAAVTPVDMNDDGYVDRLYVGDFGANIWRFDFDQTSNLTDINNLDNAVTPSVTTYLLAQLGESSPTVANNRSDRRFLYRPELMPVSLPNGKSAMMVLVGSGDREQPRSTAYDDYFFMVVDAIQADGSVYEYPVSASTITPSAAGYPVGLSRLKSVSAELGYGLSTDYGTGAGTYTGYYLALAPGVTGGEKVVNAARIDGGACYFATNQPAAANPSAGICSNLGTARAYAINPSSGRPFFDRDRDGTLESSDYFVTFTTGGLPPTSVGGTVRIVNADGSSTFKQFSIGTGGSVDEQGVAGVAASTLVSPTVNRKIGNGLPVLAGCLSKISAIGGSLSAKSDGFNEAPCDGEFSTAAGKPQLIIYKWGSDFAADITSGAKTYTDITADDVSVYLYPTDVSMLGNTWTLDVTSVLPAGLPNGTYDVRVRVPKLGGGSYFDKTWSELDVSGSAAADVLPSVPASWSAQSVDAERFIWFPATQNTSPTVDPITTATGTATLTGCLAKKFPSRKGDVSGVTGTEGPPCDGIYTAGLGAPQLLVYKISDAFLTALASGTKTYANLSASDVSIFVNVVTMQSWDADTKTWSHTVTGLPIGKYDVRVLVPGAGTGYDLTYHELEVTGGLPANTPPAANIPAAETPVLPPFPVGEETVNPLNCPDCKSTVGVNPKEKLGGSRSRAFWFFLGDE